jgi:putative ABC transport system permease protein
MLLTESLVLAMGGAALGIAIAYALSRVLATRLPESWAGAAQPGLNWTVVAFMAMLAIVTAVVFGLAPALSVGRDASHGSRVKGDRRGRSMQSALVVAQAALALVLMAGSGLMIESVRKLLNVDVGFDGSRVLTAEYRLPRNKYPNGAQQSRFHDEVVASLQRLPGVESAAIVRGLPFSGNGGITEIGLPDRPPAPPSAPFTARYNAATPTYFETVRIPLRAGRSFAGGDTYNAPRVVIVSDSFVERYWPGRDAIGRQVLIPDEDRVAGSSGKVPATVVGVVGMIRHDGLDEAEMPQIYVPYAQDPFIFATIVMRTRDNPLGHVRDLQQALWSVDKDQPVWKIRTLASLVDRSLGPRRLVIALLGFFSAVALALSALGLYGVLSYRVTQETAELGIRVAVGAAPWDILGMVLRRGMILVGAGLLFGIVAAPLLAGALRTQLFGVGTIDARMYGLVAALLLLVGGLASLLPARRAMRLDPARALRAE